MNRAVGTHIAKEIGTLLMVDTPKSDLALESVSSY